VLPQLHLDAAEQAGRGAVGNATGSRLPGAPGSGSAAKPSRRLENFLKLPPPACARSSVQQRLCSPTSFLSRYWQSPYVFSQSLLASLGEGEGASRFDESKPSG